MLEPLFLYPVPLGHRKWDDGQHELQQSTVPGLNRHRISPLVAVENKLGISLLQ